MPTNSRIRASGVSGFVMSFAICHVHFRVHTSGRGACSLGSVADSCNGVPRVSPLLARGRASEQTYKRVRT